MAITHQPTAARTWHPTTPGVGRPVLFAVLLVIASLGMLALLVVGPSLPLGLAITSAAALMAVVGIAWLVAGPRL